MGTSRATGGVQSAVRVLTLLRHVGAHHATGIRLKDLITLSGIDRSTAHRLLACLVKQAFVERPPGSQHYRLGMEAMQLGLVSAGMAPVIERLRPAMQKIARLTGDTVFLIVQSGDHALCLHREEGSYPIKAFVVEPGSRRLLGLSAVGVDRMARMEDADVAAMHARHPADYARAHMSLARLMSLIRAARRSGHAEMVDARTEQTSGVGCAFQLSAHSYAGISIAAINARMPARRRAELGTQLRTEVQPFEWTETGDAAH
ncbi:IclR family transcriptional regulator [Variovorax sp. PBL-E5]|uniref:IclR family transcriptional regulator n=1 Tax=Variovorax sp. PBL-E5 TaxID=434014 RepID=UPI001316140B|nr:helix-turn-helix domain-containing protein [Variovorax sp. PBL-E5]VTU21538.1 Kip operon repressor protein [Variovorax sp. PBL-E5]